MNRRSTARLAKVATLAVLAALTTPPPATAELARYAIDPAHSSATFSMRHFVTQVLAEEKGPVVAVSNYMKLVPDQIARWVPGGLFTLSTDGFNQSDTHAALRRFFEVDAEHVVLATLSQLARQNALDPAVPQQTIAELELDPEKSDPLVT